MSIYYLYNQNLNLGVGFFFAGLVAPTLCTAVLVNTYYMGRRDFKMFALAQNFVDVVQLLSIALLAYFSKDFVVITSAYFVATLVANILIVWQAVNGDKKYKMGKNIPQVLVGLEEVEDKKFKSKLNISAIIMGFTYQMDKLLIFHFIGAVPLAVYSIVTAIGDQARTPVKALASALFPRMTKDIFTKKKLFVSFGLLTGFCLVIFVTLFLLYPLIFEYLFPKYSEYIYLANLASITILFAPIQLLYLYCQSKNDLQTLNTYANLNTILQIVLFSASAFLVSLPMFLISRSLIMFISTIYLVFRINKL
jgi:O-antigen/teichoic acid export membrane protein